MRVCHSEERSDEGSGPAGSGRLFAWNDIPCLYKTMYADVIVDISHKAVDRTFSYRIPKELEEDVSVGTQVMIPFGKGDRSRKGYVVALSETTAWDPSKVKDLLGVSKGSLPVESRMIRLAGWMREHYGCTMISALETVTPVKQKVRSRKQKVDVRQFEPEFLPIESLNEDQKQAFDIFAEDFDAGLRKTYLLHGVTGSGKTEVYLQMAKHVIENGQKVIVLVPEIALTYQTVARFRTAFADRIAILHSGLSRGEKYREYEQAMEGSADILIGPRSALFAPFTDLGLIIIDEEHDTAYKSDTMPKYHAREVALERGRMEGAAVVLGSATPAVESYRNAEEGRYTLLSLPDRVEQRALAETEVVDLREELKEGNRSILSRKLYGEMQEAFERGEQVMLFLNRRGMSSFVSCRSCGEAIRCPKCDVSLALHGQSTLLCHYCGYSVKMPSKCPACGSGLIGGYGIGTERVEQEVNKLFPGVRTIRMDRDTTQKKGSHGALLQEFHDGRAQCLVGTQMIVKGHDFPDVTVVGVLLADLGLFDSDFRSGERCYDLLTQAAGRAGRGDRPGHVVIQTYRPEHYVIQTAAAQDYLQFYTYEMAYRRLLGYPPVTHMLGILISAKDEGPAAEFSDRLAEELETRCKDTHMVMTGPGNAYIYRLNEVYRKVIYLRSESKEELMEIPPKLKAMTDEAYENSGIEVYYDFDPLHIL